MSDAVPEPGELERWREAARIAAGARELGVRLAVPGALRRDIAEAVEGFVRERGAEPAFPANLSRNQEAAHYTPDDADELRLVAGDLLKVDVGAHLDGAVADTAETVEVGGGHRHAHLIASVHDALSAGIRAVRPGGAVDDVSRAIADAIRARGLTPVRDLTGHSIERYVLHAGKSIPNVPGLSAATFTPGEIVAIEPFATNGEGRIANGAFGHIVRFRRPPPADDAELSRLFERFRTLPFTPRWARSAEERAALERGRRLLQSYPVFLERAGGLVAQAEHTIRVGPSGAEVLTVAGGGPSPA
jgi:methionyl aminopeptidase